MVSNYVPVAIYNDQPSPTPIPFDEEITVKSSNYILLENSDLSNVVWFTSNGTVIPSWIENGDSNISQITIYWLKMTIPIGAYSVVDIYLGFEGMNQHLFSPLGNEGVAPTLTSNYAGYDNGANVFNIYFNGNAPKSDFNIESGLSFSKGVYNGNQAIEFSGSTSNRQTGWIYKPSSMLPGDYLMGVNMLYNSGNTMEWDMLSSTTAGTSNVYATGVGTGAGSSSGSTLTATYVTPSDWNSQVLIGSGSTPNKNSWGFLTSYTSGGTDYVSSGTTPYSQPNNSSYGENPISGYDMWAGSFWADADGVNMVMYTTFMHVSYAPPSGIMPSASFGSIHSQYNWTGFGGQDAIYLGPDPNNPYYYGLNDSSTSVQQTLVPGYTGVYVNNSVGLGTGSSLYDGSGAKNFYYYFDNTQLTVYIPIGVSGAAAALNESGPFIADPNATVRDLNISASVTGGYTWGNYLTNDMQYQFISGNNTTGLQNIPPSNELKTAISAAGSVFGLLSVISVGFFPASLIFFLLSEGLGVYSYISNLSLPGIINHHFNETQNEPAFAKMGITGGNFNVHETPDYWFLNSTNSYSFETFLVLHMFAQGSNDFNTAGTLSLSAQNLLSYDPVASANILGAKATLNIPMLPATLLTGQVLDNSVPVANQEVLITQTYGNTVTHQYEKTSPNGDYRFYAEKGSSVTVQTTSVNGTTYSVSKTIPSDATTSIALNLPFDTTPDLNFTESGLPTGTVWSVSTGSTGYNSTSNVISVPQNFGQYTFTVGNIPSYLAVTPSITVTNADQLSRDFSILFEPTGNVTFSESGLPSSDYWSVTLNGTHKTVAAGNSIHFTEPYDTYSYTVSSQNGYVPTPSSSIVSIGSSPQYVSIAYNLKPYTITFNEGGLPGGTTWSMTFGGSTKSSSSSTISFSKSDGSYSFNVPDVYYSSTKTYYPSPSSGTITVSGSSQSESIQFTGEATSCVYSLAPILLSNYNYLYAENITLGEHIMTYNLSTGTMQEGTVIHIFVTHHPDMYVINDYLRVARDQDIWTNHGYIQAQNLTTNDKIMNVFTHQFVRIHSISVEYGSYTMYDFRVSVNPNYIIWNNLMEDRLP